MQSRVHFTFDTVELYGDVDIANPAMGAWICPCYFCILHHFRAAKCRNYTENSKL